MTTYFVWIETISSPPGRVHPRISFAVEQLPNGPVRRLEGLRILEEATAKRCELLRQQNGIQVSIDGEHTLEYIVDKALAKIGHRHDAARRETR